jgi:hypothetical protein
MTHMGCCLQWPWTYVYTVLHTWFFFTSTHISLPTLSSDTCAMFAGVVDWSWSRQFFYGRLRRRLAENQALQRMAAVDPSGERGRHKQLLHNVIKAQVKDQKRRLPSYDNIENHVMEAKVSRSEEDKTVSFRFRVL